MSRPAGWTGELLTFAMDHRDSYRTLLAMEPPLDAGQDARAREVKSLVFDGFAAAVDRLGSEGLAVLLDEEYGAPLAARAHELGVLVCAPVEHSGRAELELEYADTLPRLVDGLGVDLLKVLLRYNPEGDAGLNARQAARVAELSAWCVEQEVPLMCEVLVPPTAGQRAAGLGRWDAVLRPGLNERAMIELRAAGADPSIWKIEGLDDAAQSRRAVEAARCGGRDEVACVVLGRGESLSRVETWLRVGAGTDGFVGFAVGRSLWNDEARAAHRGELDGPGAVTRIAGKYERLCHVWREATWARVRQRGRP